MNITMLGIWGAYPEQDSATSSVLIEEDGFNLLIDCGSGVLSQLPKYIQLKNLDALIISHYHHDHIADIGCLQYALMLQKNLGQITNKEIFPIYGHIKDLDKFKSLSYLEVTKGISISEDDQLTIGPFEVSFCSTIHPAYGLAIKLKTKGKTVVYTSDTEWNEPLVDFSKDADLIISEANLYEDKLHIAKGHLTGSQVGILAKRANAKQVILTHLPHHGNHQEILLAAEKEFSGDVILAKPGLKLSL